nr:nickel-responsive transcriptional regulator NikR [Campylobacter sp.]
MDKVIRFSVSLPPQLLKKLDDMIDRSNYASRSEFTRDLIRDKIARDSWSDSNAKVIAVLVISYDHHEGELVMRKMSIEHDAKVEIVCTNHIHIDHHNCLETMILKGSVKEVESFKDNIAGLKGVKFANLTRAAVPEY